MNASPSLSIAMATYNGGRFIKNQLESLAKQTKLPHELVITDDCSNDDTLEIVNAFAATAPFPVHIEKNKERLGYRANFLKAASLCQSDIIAFCDQDDIWLPEKLNSCLPYFEDDAVSLVFHNASVVDNMLAPYDTLNNCSLAKKSNPAFSLGPWQFGLGFTLLFRRELMTYSDRWQQSTDFYDILHREAHDQWIFFLASNLGSVIYLNEPFVLYRQHGKNAYGWDSKVNTIRGKFENLFNTKTDRILSYELCAKHRSRILKEIAEKLDIGRRSALLDAGDRYAKIANYYGLRGQLYNSRSRAQKIYHLTKLACKGGYSRRKFWGVGPQALVRDFVRGVVFPAKLASDGEVQTKKSGTAF